MPILDYSSAYRVSVAQTHINSVVFPKTGVIIFYDPFFRMPSHRFERGIGGQHFFCTYGTYAMC